MEDQFELDDEVEEYIEQYEETLAKHDHFGMREPQPEAMNWTIGHLHAAQETLQKNCSDCGCYKDPRLRAVEVLLQKAYHLSTEVGVDAGLDKYHVPPRCDDE